MKTEHEEILPDCLRRRLDDTRMDKGIEPVSPGSFLPEGEDPPTDPGVPRAKGRLSSQKCEHGLRLADCDECALRANVTGMYSFHEPQSAPDTAKEK